jgi:hypothetical protein
MGRTGRGVPRVALQAAPGRFRIPALRHYERTREGLHGAQRRKAPRISAEPEAINPAVERREASAPDAQTALPCLRGTRGALHKSACGRASLAREGCRCTRAPVGAPPPRVSRGHLTGRMGKNRKARRSQCLARRMKHAC